MSSSTAVSVADFINSIGVNTHIDEATTAYGNTALVESELTYLGVTNVRDAMPSASDEALFQSVAAATGVKFDFAISGANAAADLAELSADVNITRFVEGANESDEPGQGFTYAGLTGFAATAALQQTLYNTIASNQLYSGIAVIGPSYGMSASFAEASNTSATSNDGNTHEYFNNGSTPSSGLAQFMSNAEQVSGSDPLIATEAGYYTGPSWVGSAPSQAQSGVDDTVQAKYDLTLLFDDWAAGIKTTYLYELMDEASDPNNTTYADHYGLYNADGTPKTAATALHNLVSILSDSGTTPRHDTLGYQITGLPSTANSLLMEKSTGVFQLALWNDVQLWNATTQSETSNAPVAIQVNFGQIVQSVAEYDPLTGTSSILTWSNVQSITVNLVDHPIVLAVTTYPAGVLSLANFVMPEAVGTGITSGQITPNLWTPLVNNGTETNPNWLSGISVTAVNTTGTAGYIYFNAATHTLTYTAPAYNPFNPTDSFTYTLSDAHGDSVTGTMAITEVAPANVTYGIVAGASLTAPSSGWTLDSQASGETQNGSAAGGDSFIAYADTTVLMAGNNDTVTGGAGSRTIKDHGNNATVSLGNGNNTIYVYGTGNVVTAGNGNNVVWKPIGSTSIAMGNGNETITVEGTNNSVSIGSGTSSVTMGTDGNPAGNEQVTVGGGTNMITVGGTNDSIVVQGGTNNSIHTSAGSATVELMAGSNTVIASGNANVVTALAGTNTINASGNNNTVTGGAGADTIWVGGTGNAVTGGSGSDTVSLNLGNNTIAAGSGHLTLNAYSSGNTLVLGAAGVPEEQVYGNMVSCNDVLDLRAALNATSWDDNLSDLGNYLTVTNSGSASVISIDADGTGGNPAVAIANLNNVSGLTLQTLLAHAIVPQAKQDDASVAQVATQSDETSGSTEPGSTETASGAPISSAPVTSADVAVTPNTDASGTITGYTYAAGAADDTIATAAGQANMVWAGAGQDVVYSAGNDTICASLGNSLVTVIGGANALQSWGADFVSGGSAGGNVIAAGDGNATLTGGGNGDFFIAGSGNDQVTAVGSAVLFGSAAGAQATFFGAATGNAFAIGNGGDMTVNDGGGANVTYGGAGNTTVNDSTGNDWIIGGAGQMTVNQGSGTDDVIAGSGSMVINAGTGQDVLGLYHGTAGGDVTINGFNVGSDQIFLSGYGTGAAASAIADAQVTSAGTALSLTDGSRVMLTGITTPLDSHTVMSFA